jgi:hypothetical protein
MQDPAKHMIACRVNWTTLGDVRNSLRLVKSSCSEDLVVFCDGIDNLE